MYDDQATIPAAQWNRSTENLKIQTEEQPTKKLLRKFTYDLQAEKISRWLICESSCLFFEYQSIKRSKQGKNSNVLKLYDEFILIELIDFTESEDDSEVHRSFQYQNDSRREQILRQGILVNDNYKFLTYSLIGTSNSGVQEHSYVFRRGSLEKNEEIVLKLMPRLYELEKKKGAPKRVKYQGLLFSGVNIVNLPLRQSQGESLLDVEVKEIESVERNFDFTDGVGVISLKLARHLQRELGKTFSSVKGSVPSVWQIRYAGKVRRLDNSAKCHVCKGVLVVDHANDTTHALHFRKSMLKEEVSADCASVLGTKLGVIEWSRLSQGKISQQLLCLLTASVPDKDLEEMQAFHLDAIANAATEPLSVARLAGLDMKSSTWDKFKALLFGLVNELRFNSVLENSSFDKSESDCTKMNQSDLNVDKKDKKTKGISHSESATSSFKNQEVAGDTPSRSYSAYKLLACCHTKHLSFRHSKVQIPLACSRTFYGAAYPQYLGEFLKEGECLVMLEDGPLKHEVRGLLS